MSISLEDHTTDMSIQGPDSILEKDSTGDSPSLVIDEVPNSLAEEELGPLPEDEETQIVPHVDGCGDDNISDHNDDDDEDEH